MLYHQYCLTDPAAISSVVFSCGAAYASLLLPCLSFPSCFSVLIIVFSLLRSLVSSLHSIYLLSPRLPLLSLCLPLLSLRLPSSPSPLVSLSSPLVSLSSPLVSLSSPLVSLSSPLVSLSSPLVSLSSPLLSLSSPIVSLSSPSPLSSSLSFPPPLAAAAVGAPLWWLWQNHIVNAPAISQLHYICTQCPCPPPLAAPDSFLCPGQTQCDSPATAPHLQPSQDRFPLPTLPAW